jgi:predicted permease
VLAIAGIFLWIGLGAGARRAGASAGAFAALNRAVLWACLPATILLALHRMPWDPSYWAPVSMAWLVFAAAALLFPLLGRALGWPRGTVGALVLTAGLGNTSFVGFPLLRALYGEGALKIAILNDQPGSFLALSTVGVAAASWYSSGRASPRAALRRVLTFPPAWALAAVVALRPVEFPAPLVSVLHALSQAMVPLALIAVGGNLDFRAAFRGRERGALEWGLAYKLILAPLMIAALLLGVLGLRGEAARVTVLEAAMGPMITGAAVAAEHGLDPELCAALVSLGVPACLVLVPLAARLLAALGV